MTQNTVKGWCVPAFIGMLALALALALPNRLIAWSGWIYFSLAVLVPAHRWLRRRALARFDGITKSEHQL